MVGLMQLHVDERAKVYLCQAGRVREVGAAPDVWAETGITGFEVHLPHMVMAVLGIRGKDDSCRKVVDFEIRLYGIVRDGVFGCSQWRVGRFDPVCAIPSAAEQSGFKICFFGRSGFTSFVVPYGHSPIVTGGRRQWVAVIRHVYLAIGFDSAGGPYLFAVGGIGEYGDFIGSLPDAPFIVCVHHPTEHRFFHIDTYRVFHGFRT